jgi:two-component system chemotaxis sensor kinase CheA
MKNLFVKLTRAVHDAAGALGKEVEFATIGEDTEVDKVLSEGLADPLMHMVRNSVDHGQESGDERVAAGKNRKGRIELSARCEGGFLVVRLCDDGKGLDTEAILAKARAKGIVGPKQELTDQQIFALIFQPSFSTKAVVTEVSGRGVGMDVVQTNIHAMRGHIDIQSQRGKGTTFMLTIPLAISLLDGMIVQLGDEKWILPLHMVVQSFRYGSCELSHAVGVGEVLTLRGENIPVADLAKVLQVPKTEKSQDRVVIVAKDKDVRVALVVDAVIGIQTVVSKPLTPEMQARDGIAGCAILGDGKTSLILEVASLHKSTARARRAA